MSHRKNTQNQPLASAVATDGVKPSNFLRQIIESDLVNGTYASRKWGGSAGDAEYHAKGQPELASPNISMRDPAIYRIRRAKHHNTGDKWCIYPMYTYAHPIEDALEQITHSICMLEFEDQRPFYNWLMARLIEGGLLASPPPHQYEFARVNERHGYFVADRADHVHGTKPVFNLAVGLKDSWGK